MNGAAVPRASAARPASTAPTIVPRKKPEKTHPYRPTPPRSSATAGITVEMARDSKATSVTVRTSPAVSRRRPGAHTPPVSDGRLGGEGHGGHGRTV